MSSTNSPFANRAPDSIVPSLNRKRRKGFELDVQIRRQA